MSKKKVDNICLTITSLASGGAEKQCLLLANLLQEDFNVQVIIIDDNPVYPGHLAYLNHHKIRYIFLPGGLIQKIRTLRTILLKDKIDLIFSYLPKDIIISTIASRGVVKKHVGGIRNALMAKSKIKVLRFIHNHFLHASISNCASGKEFFTHQGLRENKIHVIPNGIKIETTPLKRPNHDTVTISTFGRLVEQKDFETAIRSFQYLKSQLHPKDPGARMQIVGSGPMKPDLQKIISHFGLGKEILLIDNADDLGSILRNSDIYLCTSVFEGVSNAIMEAMAYSLPVVATDAGDNKTLVHHDINGYITPIKDHIGIGNALITLMRTHEKRLLFGQKSFEILQKNHDLPIFKDQYLSFISEIQ